MAQALWIVLTLVFVSGTTRAETPDRGFSDLVRKVRDGVVNISTFARPRSPGPLNPNDPFRNFFEEFFGGRIPGPPAPPSPPSTRAQKPQPFALGTGFLIDPSGLILTNHHVIGGAEEVKVQFKENEDYFPAEITGRDPELDIALLSIKTTAPVTALPLGDSDAMEVGDLVLAIGNPLGYGHTVTHGILSAKERVAPELKLAKYLQTDASINPGNSGGPLLNLKGEVIGINNAIDARGQGIGFAIPVNLVKKILPELKSKGSVSRGYLGIAAADLNDEISEQLKLKKGTRGVMVAEVMRGEAADRAGIKPYDVITAVNQAPVSTPMDLTAKVTAIKVGESIELTLIRSGKEKSIQVKVGERPTSRSEDGLSRPAKRPAPKEEALKDWGLEVQELNEESLREFGLPGEALSENKKGVLVTDLAYGRPAAESGLARGDLLLDVGGVSIRSRADLERELKKIKAKSTLVRVRRYGPGGQSGVQVILLKKD